MFKSPRRGLLCNWYEYPRTGYPPRSMELLFGVPATWVPSALEGDSTKSRQSSLVTLAVGKANKEDTKSWNRVKILRIASALEIYCI